MTLAATRTSDRHPGPQARSCGLWWPVEHLLEAAVERAEAVPDLKRSMRGLNARIIGAIGELVAVEYLREIGVRVLSDAGDTKHDIATEHGKLEVKTKDRTVPVQPHYECSVADYHFEHQLPDWYLFVNLVRDKRRDEDVSRFQHAEILGTISRVDFERRAIRWEAGQTDPRNGWVVTETCWNVRVDQLRPPRYTEVRLTGGVR